MIKKLYVEYITNNGDTELLIENSGFEIAVMETEDKIVRDVSYLYSSFLEMVDENLLKPLIFKLSTSLALKNVVKYNSEEDLFYLDSEYLSTFLSNNKNILLLQIQNHKDFLNNTDWYVVRFLETGVEVPELIKAQRAEKRIIISSLTEQLNLLPELNEEERDSNGAL
jgi:hypothetical protein